MILFFLCALFLAGCEEWAPLNEHRMISIQTKGHVNGTMAVAVDIVMVYDEQLFAKLKMLNAREFLLNREKIISDNPDGIAVWRAEFIEYEEKHYRLPFDKNYWGIIVFIHFTDGTSGKIVIPENQSKTRITIVDDNFTAIKDMRMCRYQNLSVGEFL